jgi:hypothetical protein
MVSFSAPQPERFKLPVPTVLSFKENDRMAKEDYHVVPHNDGWAVRREGAERVSSQHGTQTEAIQAGQSLARNHGTELVIHRPDGTIRDSDSYGRDPSPPRDRKH